MFPDPSRLLNGEYSITPIKLEDTPPRGVLFLRSTDLETLVVPYKYNLCHNDQA